MSKSDDIYRDLVSSNDFLKAVLAQPPNDYMRAAAIQAFEISYELAWKYLQVQLRATAGVDASSPKAVIREAAKAELLADPAAWLAFADYRNLTTHTYRPALADEVLATITNDFAPALQHLIESLAPSQE